VDMSGHGEGVRKCQNFVDVLWMAPYLKYLFYNETSSNCFSLSIKLILLLQLFTAPWTLSGTTHVSWYQKGKTNLDLLEQEIVSHQLSHMQICTSPQTDNHSVLYRPDALPATQLTAPKLSGLELCCFGIW